MVKNTLEQTMKEEEKNLFGKVKDFGKRHWYKMALPLLSLFFIPNTAKADRYKITINHPDKWERITYRETDADSGDIWVKDLHSNEPIANAEMIWENLDTNLYKIFYTDDNGHAIGSLPSYVPEEYNDKEGIKVIKRGRGVFLDYDKNFNGGLYDVSGRLAKRINGSGFVSVKDLTGIHFLKLHDDKYNYESAKVTILDGLVVSVSDYNLERIIRKEKGLFGCSNPMGPSFSEPDYSLKGIESIEEFNLTTLGIDTTSMDFYNYTTDRISMGGTARWDTMPVFLIDTLTNGGYSSSEIDEIINFINNNISYMTQGLMVSPLIVLADFHYTSPTTNIWQFWNSGTPNPGTSVASTDTNDFTINFVDMHLPNGFYTYELYQEMMHGIGFLEDNDLLASVLNNNSTYTEFQLADSMIIEILCNRPWNHMIYDTDPMEYWFNNGKNRNTTWNKELKVKEEDMDYTANLKYF